MASPPWAGWPRHGESPMFAEGMRLRSRQLSSRRRPTLGFLIGALCCAATRVDALPTCAGDCDGNQQVTISELIRGLGITLGRNPIAACPAFDVDGNGGLGIDELIAAVDAALSGCPPAPTPSETQTPGGPTETPTGTPSLTPTPRATPPLSARVCGDGTMQPGEECDDGNPLEGDGCSAGCRSEARPDLCAGVVPITGTGLTGVRVAAGLAQPLYATAPPGDLARLFIVEQGGRIRVLRDDRVLPTPFLDIRNRVQAGGELGLLGLAFHPALREQRRVLRRLHDQARRRDTLGRVALPRVGRSGPGRPEQRGDPARTRPAVRRTTTAVSSRSTRPATCTSRSATADNRPATAGQRRRTRRRGSARSCASTSTAALPTPFRATTPSSARTGVLDEIWALGLRNPWRFSFDRGDRRPVHRRRRRGRPRRDRRGAGGRWGCRTSAGAAARAPCRFRVASRPPRRAPRRD